MILFLVFIFLYTNIKLLRWKFINAYIKKKKMLIHNSLLSFGSGLVIEELKGNGK